MPVLHSIANGATTYGELRKVLATVSDQMLAKRLRELVDEGLAIKIEGRRGEGPRYAATPAAEAVLAIMEDICAWEKRYSKGRASAA